MYTISRCNCNKYMHHICTFIKSLTGKHWLPSFLRTAHAYQEDEDAYRNYGEY